MIQLQIKEYCKNCGHFEPKCERTILYADEDKALCDTYVFCSNQALCEHIADETKKALLRQA